MYKFNLAVRQNTPQEFIDMRLTETFLSEIGGLRTFNDKRIVMYIKFDKRQDEYSQYIKQDIHTLSVELTNVLTKDFVEYNPPKFHEIEVKYTRWDRFKQFIKGE